MSSVKIILIVIFTYTSMMFSSQTALSQVNLDSLWGVWNDPVQPDTIRLKAIHKFAEDGYIHSQPDSAFYFAQLEYDFAESKRLKKQMANALRLQGLSFYFQSSYTMAMDYYTRSMAIREEIGDKQGIATSLNSIGSIYKKQNNYTIALEYYTRSLTIREEIGDKKGIAASLNNIGLLYWNQGDYVKAIDYNTRSLKIKEEIGDKKGIATSLNNIGLIYWSQGDYTKAIDNYTLCLSIKEEIDDRKGVAKTLNNIGVIYKDQGNYASAISHHTRSLNIKEEIGDKQGVAKSLNNIGNIYYEQRNYTSAFDYYTHSLAIKEEIEDKQGIATSLNNIGIIYKHQGDYISAIDNYTRSLNIRKEIEDKHGIATSLNNIGAIFMLQGDYTNAIDNYTHSLNIREEIEDKIGIAIVLINIGMIYKKQGDSAYLTGNSVLSEDKYARAIALSTRALTIAQEIGAANETRDAAKVLFLVYKTTHNHKASLEMHQLYVASRDNINSEKNQREVIRQKYKYEYEKKELANSDAHDEEQRVQEEELKIFKTQLYYLTGGLTLLIGLLGFLYSRFRVIRKQKHTIEHQRNKIKSALKKEKELGELKSKFVTMTSHEFRTPLAAIKFASGSVKKYWERLDVDSRNEKLDKIETQVNHMTLLLDDILFIGKTESGKITSNFKLFNFNEFIKPIIDEVYILSKNSHKITLLNKNLDITILIDERLGRNIFINLLNNAIKFSPGKKEVILEVINFDDKMIQIKIIDFGIGIKNENIENIFTPFYREENAESIQGTGLGLSIVKDAVRLSKGTINVESTIDKETTFIINLLKK